MNNIGNNATNIKREVVVKHSKNSFEQFRDTLYNYINEKINNGDMPVLTFSIPGHEFPFTLDAEMYEEFEKFLIQQEKFYKEMFE